MIGLSTIGSISLGCAFVAGRNRVPNPAAGNTALRTFDGIFYSLRRSPGATQLASGTSPRHYRTKRDSLELNSSLELQKAIHCRGLLLDCAEVSIHRIRIRIVELIAIEHIQHVKSHN